MRAIPGDFSLFEQDLQHIETTAAASLDQLRGAHIFLTGGTGLFGIWLVEAILYANARRNLGLELTVLSRDPARARARYPHLARHPALHFGTGDILDFVVKPHRPITHMLHLASESNIDQRADWPYRHVKAALAGTERLLDFAAAQRVQSALVTTSGAVYLGTDVVRDGRFVEGPRNAADLVGEKSVYGESKRMMEVMTAIWGEQHGFRAPIARCFAFVGPYLSLEANYAIGNFMRDALAGRDIVVGGDGTPLRSYLYMADLAVWLIELLVRGATGTPCNVGGETAISIGDLARLVARVAGGKSGVVVRQQPVPGAPVSSYLPDISRARALGLTPAVELEDAISRTLDWYRAR